MANVVNEHIRFRYLVMGCCKIQLCWVNPRLPNYCPECGQSCFANVKGYVTLYDEEAHITYHA